MEKKYRVGSQIKYEAFGGEVRTVRVTDKYSDIKNGRPGFDGVIMDTDFEVWGYDSQIISVITY